MPKKPRATIPTAVKVAVLNEFNHRCAICGADKPQLHHINGDRSNSSSANLIPLCPNCHLTDQHNPTSPFDPEKIALFRHHKDPTILTPQFEPLFRRMKFLRTGEIDIIEDGPIQLWDKAYELIAFVEVLTLGNFYANRIKPLLVPSLTMETTNSLFEEDRAEAFQHVVQEHKAKVLFHRLKVEMLVVELLRYQNWHQQSGFARQQPPR